MIMSEGRLIKLRQEIDKFGPWIPQVANDGRDMLEILVQDVKRQGSTQLLASARISRILKHSCTHSRTCSIEGLPKQRT